jgi:hypothetical protein
MLLHIKAVKQEVSTHFMLTRLYSEWFNRLINNHNLSFIGSNLFDMDISDFFAAV